jgi:hypothetical protein
MPRTLIVTALLALVLCGSAVAAATGDPQLEIVAADQAWAESIVLDTPDLGPGWQRFSADGGGGGAGDAACPGMNVDESDLVVTGGTASPTFVRNDGAIVVTTAVVWQTAAHAQADWDRYVQPSLLSCLASGISAGSTKKVKIVVTGKRMVSSFPAVAPRTAAFRLTIALKTSVKVRKKLRKISVPATFDFVVLGNGRAMGVLAALSFNAKPLTDTSKQSLALMMAQRMASDPSPAP